MEPNGADEVMISGNDATECPETTVEIKIKTLDSQTYTLRVNKCMPVPALKEQIASVTGVVSEHQRLICRGKVLKDDQLLSAYHVEDGHTLHLVVRQPFHPSSSSSAGGVGPETASDHPDPSSNAARNRSSHVAHSVVLGTFNIADQGEGSMPDMNRFVSALLSSVGISNFGIGGDGVDLRDHGLESVDRTSVASGTSASTQGTPGPTPSQVQSDPLHGAFRFPSAASFGPVQPTVIPDSLTTMSQYLSHMKNEFNANGRNSSNDLEASGIHSMEVQNPGQGLPTPASLAEIMLSTRQMLMEQAAECLSQLARQLEDQASVTDPLLRTSLQSSTIRSGILMQNLGAMLLELGRTTMTLRMGQTPSEAVVNAGPAVYISTSGPNPLMVQPLPFQPGTSFGSIPSGAFQSANGLAGGILGSGVIPRNIDIRIRAGRSVPTANASQGDQAGAQQPPGQPGQTNSSGANLLQQTVSAVSGGSSFTVESGVRVVPVRTVVAAVPAALRRPPSDASGSSVGLFYPLLARVQHLNPGQSSDTRGPQPSVGTNPTGPGTSQQPIPEAAAVHQQNLGPNGPTARGNGDSQTANFLSGNAATVASAIGSSANLIMQNLQGSVLNSNLSEREPADNSIRPTQPSNVQQNGRESMPQIPSRFDQLLWTIFSGDQIHVSDLNFQGTGSYPITEQRESTRDAYMNAGSGVDIDPGVFFSGLVRQIMPFISQATATAIEMENAPSTSAGGSAPESSTSQAERETSPYAQNSHHHDPPSPPDSKRQKRE